MKKVYKYENGAVYLKVNNRAHENIVKSTERFLKKVIKETRNSDAKRV